MPGLEICLTPDLIGHYDLDGKAVVVVDILRATSCMTTGMAYGVDEIRPYMNLEDCRKKKESGFLIAGERGGQKLPDFDLGNSPFDYMDESVQGRKIAVTTTNGTVAIEKSKTANHIFIGSFLNIRAVADRLHSLNLDVVIFCAGWKGRVNLEDTLFAGALMDLLGEKFVADGDAPMVALHCYRDMKDNLLDYVLSSSHAQRLKRLNIEHDIAYCMKWDEFDVVPEVIEGSIRNS